MHCFDIIPSVHVYEIKCVSCINLFTIKVSIYIFEQQRLAISESENISEKAN